MTGNNNLQPNENVHDNIIWIKPPQMLENVHDQNYTVIFLPCVNLSQQIYSFIYNQPLLQKFQTQKINNITLFLYLKLSPISIIQHPHSIPLTYSEIL